MSTVEEIAEFPAYTISTDGDVWRAVGGAGARVHKMKPSVDKDGYLCVELSSNGISKRKKVSRLVATTFIPNPENKPLVDHINRVKTDNRVENLRWATHAENRHNTGLQRRNRSGYVGVTYRQQYRKYEATIESKGQYCYLGMFGTAEDSGFCQKKETSRRIL